MFDNSMTPKEKLLLFFLVHGDQTLKVTHKLILIFDRASFPAEIGKSFKLLLDNNLIYISKFHENGTAIFYEPTEEGILFIKNEFDEKEVLDYIRSLSNPDFLLELTTAYVQKIQK